MDKLNLLFRSRGKWGSSQLHCTYGVQAPVRNQDTIIIEPNDKF